VTKRCGCASDSCACLITPGSGIAITGSGARTNPYQITNTEAAKALQVQDENNLVLSGVQILDFQGAGVTATSGGANEVVVTIPGQSAQALGVAVQEEGVTVQAVTSTLDFRGARITASADGAGRARITVSDPPTLPFIHRAAAADLPWTSGDIRMLPLTTTQRSSGSWPTDAAGRLQVPEDGIYMITGSNLWESAGAGRRLTEVRSATSSANLPTTAPTVGPSTILARAECDVPSGYSSTPGNNFAIESYLAANTWLAVYAYQTSGSTINASSSGIATFRVRKVV